MRNLYFPVAGVIFIVFFTLIYLTDRLSIKATTSAAVIITEVMPDPRGNDDDLEWLELFNPGDASLSLKDWTINDKKLPDAAIPATAFLLLASNPDKLTAQLAVSCDVKPFNTGLTNSGGELKLKDPAGNIMQVFSYGQAKEGISFELLSGNCGTIQMDPLGNTIGQPNHSCTEPAPTPVVTVMTGTPLPVNVLIYSVCPDPENESEYFELKNLGLETISLENWRLQDLSGHNQQLTAVTVAPQAQIKVTATGISLNNNGDTLILFDELDRQVDILAYPDKLGKQCYPAMPTPVISVPAQTPVPQCHSEMTGNTTGTTSQAVTITNRYAIPKLYLDQDL